MDVEKVRTLHHRAVKAAQMYEAATPGTRDKARKLASWERAETAFAEAVSS